MLCGYNTPGVLLKNPSVPGVLLKNPSAPSPFPPIRGEVSLFKGPFGRSVPSGPWGTT